MKPMIAVQSSQWTDSVVLPTGVTLRKKLAIQDGYAIVGPDGVPQAGAVPADGQVSSERSWRIAILNLSDARNRPSAAAEILASQSQHTMSIDSARAFLRGLPVEKQESKEPPKMSTDPKAARRAEIAGSVSAFNKSRGYSVEQRGKPAASLSTVDPVRLKRLAEIRLGALALRVERGDTSLKREHKNLTYAMSVHSQTGMPLAAIFTQLGVDTSKMLSQESTS